MNGSKLGARGWNVLRSSAVLAVMLMGTGCFLDNIPSGTGTLVECKCSCGFTCELNPSTCALTNTDESARTACEDRCAELSCVFGSVVTIGDPMTCSPFPVEQGPACARSDGSMSYAGSVATITYLNDPPVQTHVTGEFRLDGGCETGTCSIEINHLYLDPDDFSIPTSVGTFDVTDAFILNNDNLVGTQSGRSFTIPSANVQVLVNGYVNGVQQSLVFTPNPTEDLTGIHVPSTGQFGLYGQFTELNGDLTLTLNLNGTVTARPPVAVVGPSQTISCNPSTGTGIALLDGSSSSDPDGNLQTVAWYEGDTSLGTGITLSTEFGMGAHFVTGYAIDSTSKFTSANTTVMVLHDAPPVFDAAPVVTVAACTPGLVLLSAPTVVDLCSALAPIVTGEVVEINGLVLATPIPVDTLTGAVTLPAGTATVLWTAETAGGVATFEQTVEISDSPDATCCGPSQVLYQGTSGADSKLDPNATTGYCMFGYEAKDRLQSGSFADFISGGPGDDMLKSQGGDDVIFGNDGDDDITYQGNGNVVISGGPGDDKIHLAFGPTSRIFAGPGNDLVTCDGGDDTIYPGAGRDTIRAGSGDDTVIFSNVCELDSNKLLNGGAGDDTLILPVPLANLNGVTVIGFEHIVVDSSQQHLAECP